MKKLLLLPIFAIACLFTRIDSAWADDTYTVTYSCGDGTGTPPTDSNTYASGSSVRTPNVNSCTAPSGYEHKLQWMCNGEVVDMWGYFTISSNTTCTVIYTPAYTVTYSCGVGSGSAPETEIAAYDMNFVPSYNTCGTPNNYRFSGWLVSGTNDVKQATDGFNWEYTENKTLTAQYTGNTINMTFDGATTTPATCSFGSTFVPPTPAPRPGYVFTGWKVKETHVQKCGIDQLDPSVWDKTQWGAIYKDTNGTVMTRVSWNYGLSDVGEWAQESSYGVVYGISKCSSTSGDTHSSAWDEPTSDWIKEISNENGIYCWCQVTGFSEANYDYTTGPQCIVTKGTKWVLFGSSKNSAICESNCAKSCAARTGNNVNFRTGMFNAVGQ